MAARPSNQPQWREVLSDESLARMALEPAINAEGQLSGYRIVFPAPDPRGRSTEVRYETPKLHVKGGDTILHGKLFKADEGKFKRVVSIKTTKDFDKNPDWIAQRPEVAAENEEYYARVDALLDRIKGLAWNVESVRARYLKDALSELRKEDIAKVTLGLKDKRAAALIAVIKSKPELLARTAKDINLDKKNPTWRDMAAKHLSEQEEVLSDPEIVKATRKQLLGMKAAKEAALNKMIADPTFAEAADVVETAREKLFDEFHSWIFYGKTADSSGGEDMDPDPVPGETHRYKMRPFYKPRKGGSSADVTLDFARADQVEIHPNAVKRAGIDGKEIFRLEAEARQQGYVVRRIKYKANFKNPKKHRLPIVVGGKAEYVPWYEDPRVDFLRPGSVVVLTVSFFIYVEPQPRIGVRMHFDEFVRVYVRGPPYGRVEPTMDMTDAAEIDDDGGGGGGGDAESEGDDQGSKRKRVGGARNGDEKKARVDDLFDEVDNGETCDEEIEGGEGDEEF